MLCFNEDLLLQEALSYLKGKGIETAVLMLDGLMIYGDHCQHRAAQRAAHVA